MGEQSGWQLSGNAPHAYEQYNVSALFKDWAQDLVETAAVRAGERVLDVACGTGIVGRTVAPVVGESGEVVGIDVNEGMIGKARSVPPPLGSAITWRQGDAAALPFADAVFDVVLCQQGVQYFAQRKKAIAEMARVLTSGGRLALSVWRPIERQPFFTALTEAIESHLGVEVGSPLRTAFSLGDAESLRGLLTSAGFHSPHIRLGVKLMRWPSLAEYLPGFISASPMAGAVTAMDAASRTVMFQGIQASLQSYVDDTGLAVPMECHVALAWT
jgi:ubiquinone/menaquinone biosynthesis C-methylase UbiE